jgi:hypothetical protein
MVAKIMMEIKKIQRYFWYRLTVVLWRSFFNFALIATFLEILEIFLQVFFGKCQLICLFYKFPTDEYFVGSS